MFATIGLVISFIRTRNENVISFSTVVIVGEMGILGLDMISDIIYILSLYSSHMFMVSATVMLVVRLIHPCTSIYIINSLFGTGTTYKNSKLVDFPHLVVNAKLYGTLLMIALVENTAIKFLPWLLTEFSRSSGGYPDIFTFRLCGYSKIGQSLVSLIVQEVVLAHFRHDARNSSACNFILIITFTSTVLVVVMTIFEIVFQVFSVQVTLNDDNTNKNTIDNTSVAMVIRIEDEVMNPVTNMKMN